VIQCLTPSAVTSLGSPAKPVLAWQQGALSAWTSELQKLGRDGGIPSRLFSPPLSLSIGDADVFDAAGLRRGFIPGGVEPGVCRDQVTGSLPTSFSRV
jgi:hypothetical protein